MWIIPQSLRSDYAAASACSMSDLQPDLNTWALTAAASCTLSGKHTRPQSWKRAWKKEAWALRLYGAVILETSTQPNFTDWWTALLRDSLAKTCQLQENAQVLTVRAAVCSSISSSSQMIAVRDTCFWRTSQASLLPSPPLWTRPKANSKSAPLRASWGNWPTAGGIRNGLLFLRQKWEPVTGEQDGSVSLGNWTTPTATERSGQGERNRALTLDVQKWATPDCNTASYSNGKRGPNIREQAAMWPTQDTNPDGRMNTSAGENQKPRPTIAYAAKAWASPKATDGTRSPCPSEERRNAPGLLQQSMSWVTPQARDAKSADVASSGNYQRKLEAGWTIDLNSQSANWPTPAARDGKGANSLIHVSSDKAGSRHMDQLANYADFSRPAQAISDGLTSSLVRHGSPQLSASKSSTKPPRLLARRLNPYFAEWLMGWPHGWTSPIAQENCAALAMELFRCKLQQHLSYLLGDLEYFEAAA